MPEQPVLSSEIRTKLQFRRCFPAFSLFLVFHLPFFRRICIPYIPVFVKSLSPLCNESDLSPRNMFSSTDVMYFMLTLKPGLPSRCILAHPRVLCALFLCLSFRSCATFSLSLIYVCWTVGPLFNIILQRSVHVYHTATSTKGIGLFEDQFVWKVPAAKARVFRSASVNDLRRAFCTLPVKMTLQATNASLAIRFC